MSDSATNTRRAFLQASGAAGGGFVLGFFLPGFARAMSDEAAAEGKFAPNAFVRIGSDDIVTVIVGRSEMGQGVLTSLPQIVADELDADWNRVRWEQSPASADYNRPGIPIMITGGSFRCVPAGSSCATPVPRRAPCSWQRPHASGAWRRRPCAPRTAW